MRIVITHFHLQTGGVTRVIEHACQALQDSQLLVLTGEAPASLPLASVQVVPALAYEERRTPLDGRALGRELERAARDHFGTAPDLWHVHNHSLGKNLALPDALHYLAEQGHRLLLQLHDFAEDGRPALYARLLQAVGQGDPARLSGRLYPQAPQIHYAVLNARDRGFLAATGVPEDRLHLLPNAVSLGKVPSAASHPFGNRRLWLYPTRAIRRKNLGELLLWAVLGSERDQFAATQAPQNPAERPIYLRWRALAEALRLPLAFELGEQVEDFAGLLRSAHALMSTSIAEGFGLAFLEPWLVGRPLAGRDLPEITADFKANGLQLDHLYAQLPVSLTWLDVPRLRQALETAFQNRMHAYGRQAEPAQLEALWAGIQQAGWIDFGRLDETAQERVIRLLRADPDARRQLKGQLGSLPDEATVAKNRALVIREYALPRYGQRLRRIYERLLASPVEALSPGNGEALLNAFLDPARFSLLRT